MRHDRHAPGLVDPRECLWERAKHRDLALDPQRQEMTRTGRDLHTRNDFDRARALRGELAQRERTANVVVIRERDHIEARPLRGVEDLLDRRETIAEVAVELKVSPTHSDQAARPVGLPQTRSNTVHCSGYSLI